MSYPGKEGSAVKLQNQRAQRTACRHPAAQRAWTRRPHRRASVSASSQGLFCAKWWETLPRGLMFLSLDLRITVFFLPQLIPSIRDLKDDCKGSREIPLLSPRKPSTGPTCRPFTDLFLVSLWTTSFGE